MSPVILLMGPTASGKSRLAMELAQRLPVELISVDSAQVYRGMDIGTAKPSAAEQAQVPHHLIDILDPAESYSAARFLQDSLRLIAEIRGRGRIPVLVGGTMLYFRALQNGLNDLPSADPILRARLEAEAATLGWPALHARLARVDPDTAARLSPNDKQRVQRALEIIEISGITPTEYYRQPNPSLAGAGPWVKLALCPRERADLHRAIELRLRQMMEQGFLEEVARLHQRHELHPDLPSIRAVGYRQLWRHLDGACTLDEAVQRALFATRQFAKRQITWLRSETDVIALDPDSATVAGDALNALRPVLDSSRLHGTM